MALAIDASTPAVVTASTATVTTASFTPPASALLLNLWAGNSHAASNPATPTITDSLGGHLTYTLTDWQSRADSPTVNGQVAGWSAPVGSSAAMTVSATSGVAAGDAEKHAALGVVVLTDTSSPTVGAHGKSGSTSAASIAQSFSATATGSWGFIVVTDWDALGSMTAGTGCTLIATGTIPSTQISYGIIRRTTADGVNGSNTTLNVTLGGTSTNVSWVYVEVKPAAVVGGVTPQPVVVVAPSPRLNSVKSIITRSTLADPPVLMTPPPLMVAGPAVRSPGQVVIGRGSLVDVAVVVAATPAPIVITQQLPRLTPTQPSIIRGSLFDATTPGPLVIAPPVTRPAAALPILERGSLTDDPVFTTAAPLVVPGTTQRPAVPPPVLVRASLADVAQAATSTPAPIIVVSPSQVQAGRALVFRSTLADPPVLTTPGALVITIPARPYPAAVLLARSSLADAAPVLTTPGALVITIPARPYPAVVLLARGTLADLAPAIATPGPLVITAQPRVTRRMPILLRNQLQCDCTTHRPVAGTTVRPNTGTTVRAVTTTIRPSTGITTRPNAGTTSRPCNC